GRAGSRRRPAPPRAGPAAATGRGGGERAAAPATAAAAGAGGGRRSVEHDHAAGHLTGPQRGEALVDLVERVGTADQLVDLEPAVEVEVDQLREVHVGPHRAVHRALDRLLL